MPQQFSDAGDFGDTIMQLLIFGGVTLLVIGLGFALATWLIVRRLRRSGAVQRSFSTGVLTARSYAVDDGVRRIARLRLDLRRSGQATRRALDAAAGSGGPIGELPIVAEDLFRAEQALENQLRMAEREPDRQLKRDLAGRIGEQVQSYGTLSADLRRSLMQAGQPTGANEIQRASTHLTREINVLQAWSKSYGTPDQIQ
ncbi:hypothetical protein [Arthrobacter flavus]|uniref:Secreted protein n=1 Tax=Arthrobacter flavus TaxID=95172 RepID=A0ABW4Q5C5_9MICC